MAQATYPIGDPLPALGLEAWVSAYLAWGRDLGTGKVDQKAWRASMDHLFSRLDLQGFTTKLDIPALRRQLAAAHAPLRGTIFCTLAHAGGPPQPGPEPERTLITKVAFSARGGHIPPHGHLNMVSSFLVLAGRFQVRQYEKVEADQHQLRLRMVCDQIQGPGQWSTVTDDRANVHWLTGLEEENILFTTKLLVVRPGAPYAGRIYLDMEAARQDVQGLLQVPIIQHADAIAQYG